MIEARQISKRYGVHQVLDDASLRVAAGESVILTGDNGSGKTTLLHILAGLRRPDSGDIIWRDETLTRAGAREWRRARETLGFLPQQVTLPPEASVDHMLRFCARVREKSYETAAEWLQRVGLEGTERQRVQALSGGMRQRLGIALTLFFEPDLIIMDEPASSLDPGWRRTLSTWVQEAAQRGAAVLVTSQLEDTWGPLARYVHCENGRIIEDGLQPAVRP